MLWLVSQICEEFHCLPSQARRELERDPERMAPEIVRLRAYARTKRVYDDHCARGEEAGKLPSTPLMADVAQNDFEWHRERREERT